MSRYIPVKIKRLVAQRAGYACEYCGLPQKAGFFIFQIEHIISLKHKGSHDLENLAYSCSVCNRNKGTDLGTLAGTPPQLTRFFHPRMDVWREHFELDETGVINPLSTIAEATVNALEMNHYEQIINRKILIEAGIITLDSI